MVKHCLLMLTGKQLMPLNIADCLIIGGTSLNVYPATGMIDYFNGKYLILINKDRTVRDSDASLVFHESIGYVMNQIII